MSLINDFNLCHRGGGWTSTDLNAQYKVIGDTLYFQSSQEMSDWHYNFRFFPENYDGVMICRGFKQMWESLEPYILKERFTKIRGYSEGAVFACLAHRLMKTTRHFTPDTVAFACPQFLWKPSIWDMQDFMGVRLYSNYNDIVTKAPPDWMGFAAPTYGITFKTKYKRPDGVGIIEWYSGHSPTQYRLNLRSL